VQVREQIEKTGLPATRFRSPRAADTFIVEAKVSASGV
jgi:hypothetical protein